MSLAVVGAPFTPATAFRPWAIESLPNALAAGPTAIASVPVGTLSANTELVWKYLIPAPLLMLEIAVVFAVTCWLVANSCDPFTASVLVAFNAAGAMLVMVTGDPAPAPPVAPSVIFVPPAASYLTAILAVLSIFVFSAVKARATVVCAVGPVTAPVLLTLLTGWLKPVRSPVAAL